MKSPDKIKSIAKTALGIEADAIRGLLKRIDNGFTDTVKLIYNSKGRVMVTGIGKSAIAQKIVATFNSTGTSSVFMHAADAIHGDRGTLYFEKGKRYDRRPGCGLG